MLITSLNRVSFCNWLLALLVCLAFAGYAAPNAHHPCVLLNEQELAALRPDLTRPGWKAALYRARRGNAVMQTGCGIRRNADLWVKRVIEIPGRGGHLHNFFCTDGDQLEFPKDQRMVTGPYHCSKCGKTYSGEKFDAAMRRLMHSWLSQAALDLALVSALEHRPEFAAKAAEILLKYAAAYPGPHTGSLTGGMIYQSLDESMWIIPLAEAYDLIHDQLTPAERGTIEAFLRLAAEGIQSCGIPGNWGSWHLSAVGVVGYAIDDQELIGWATEAFKKQIHDTLGDDGLWPESVHTYHFFPLVAFIHFAEAAWHAGADLYRWEAKPGKSLLSMFIAPLLYAYPDLRVPAINDGWFQAFLPADIYEVAWHRTQDPRFAWVLSEGYKPGMVPAGFFAPGYHNSRQGLYAFLFGRELPARGVPPAPGSVNFPVLGTCILRSTNGTMLTFDYGPFLGHGHLDKMGITLFAHRKLWLADYGTPGYGSSILPWYQSTFAHNTIVVDGGNQQRTKENNVRLWLGAPDLEAVESETREAYPGLTHTRTVARVGECFVLIDRLSSETEHTYDLYLHSEGKLRLDGKQKTTMPKSAAAPVAWIERLSTRDPVSMVSGRWAQGGSGVAFWLSGRAPMMPITAQCPAESGSRKLDLLMMRQQGTTAEFVTVLFPYQGRLRFSVQRQEQQLTITHGAATDTFAVAPVGSCPSVGRSR